MKPLGEYFINHCDVRRDAEPHMYLDNIRNAVVAAMRAGQCVAAVLRLRADDHVVRRVPRPPLTPRSGVNGGGGTTPRSAPVTPRSGGGGGGATASEIIFSGHNLRDILTKAPAPDPDGCELVLLPCMTEIIDWVYANGLTWFLATHNSERDACNAFSAQRVTLAPTQYMLCVHWYPESFAMATVPKSLHKFWIARTMPVPFEPAACTRMHTAIMQAMTMGAMHCTLLLLQRDGDFSECSYGDSRTATHVCIDPRRTLDMKPLVEQQILIAYYVNAERHGPLLRWLTVDQGLGWFLALPTEDAPWAYFVATWERVGCIGADE